MNKDLTELVFILDRSGSMSGLEKDTLGGFNAMLEKQKQLKGECRITTLLFNQTHELLHDRLDIQAVGALDESQYQVGGGTALIDALGHGIQKLIKVQQSSAPEFRAAQVMFVIITDGYENSSREFSSKTVKHMIEGQIEAGWEFIFLGANIDAVETAQQYGIGADRAQNYHADKKGVKTNFEAMSEAVTYYRSCKAMPDDWNKKITDDYKNRNKKS